jgi:hypothetical protein
MIPLNLTPEQVLVAIGVAIYYIVLIHFITKK